MSQEKWTELLREIYSAMKACPTRILAEFLCYRSYQNVLLEQQPLLLRIIDIAHLETKWNGLIETGRNLRNSAEWRKVLDELVPKNLFDHIKIPFVLCQTLNPQSSRWVTENDDSGQQDEVFDTIKEFLVEIFKTDISLHNAWHISKESFYTISILKSLVMLLRRRSDLQISMDELVMACNCLVFVVPGNFTSNESSDETNLFEQNPHLRTLLLRVFFEYVPSTTR